MSEQIINEVGREAMEIDGHDSVGARLIEINELSVEIVDLFYTQVFSHGLSTPADVCQAFSEILMRHWTLCCMMIYMRSTDGAMQLMALSAGDGLDETQAREVGRALIDATRESDGRELQFWTDNEQLSSDQTAQECGSLLKSAGLRAGVILPIHAHGSHVGALVVVTHFPERLRAALNGLRFLAAPVMVAVGNALRTEAMREQHERIAHLVEELRQHGEALEEANRELQYVAQYRSLFLARMSHELRTPLTSMLGFSEILLDQEKLTDTQRRFCEKIQSSGLQLQTSLTQLVDLSRLEAGKPELFLHEFSLREALRESCANVARLAQKRDVKIESQAASDLTPIVSDEGKLRQVLYNFLAYAIDRSPEGEGIQVSVARARPTHFQIIIEDRGETLADVSHVFEPMNIHEIKERATTANELGLAIARRLIDVLGGTIALETPEPHGLKMIIELPARPTEGGEEQG